MVLTHTEGNHYSDAAAFVYIRSCLMGRAHRFRSKQSTHASREPTTLNEPIRENGDSIDRLSMVAATDSNYDPNRIPDTVTLQRAMQCLTAKERRIIEALYFEQERVVQLCDTLQVSKNTVLKTKRKALQKLRQALQDSSCQASQEEQQ